MGGWGRFFATCKYSTIVIAYNNNSKKVFGNINEVSVIYCRNIKLMSSTLTHS